MLCAFGAAPVPGASRPDSTWRAVHVDEALLVVDKDAGLLTVPGVGPSKADCLLSRLRAAGYPEVSHAAHRLDRDTSGLIALGRTRDAHRALCTLFQDRRVSKRYEALVLGWPEADQGEVDRPIGKVRVPDGPARMCVVGGEGTAAAEQVRRSLTRWRVLERAERDDGIKYSRLALLPVTGRAHQLRLHMECVGHPLLGDELHGAGSGAAALAPRLCLHAAALRFEHPDGSGLVTLNAACPF